jgi:hypothetical protein
MASSVLPCQEQLVSQLLTILPARVVEQRSERIAVLARDWPYDEQLIELARDWPYNEQLIELANDWPEIGRMMSS